MPKGKWMRYGMVGACLGTLLAFSWGTLVQAQVSTGKPVSMFEKMKSDWSEKEKVDFIESVCANPPISNAPVPQEYITMCGHRTAPTVIPTTLAPEVQRGPIITQDAGHQTTGLGTSSVAGIGTLTSFGALVYPGTDFPGDLEVLQTDLQNVYQLTSAGLSSRYNSAGVNTALPNVAPPAGAGWSDLAVDPTTGTVYGAASVCTTSSALYTINLTTGASVLIGNITNATCLVGLAADNLGNLWGFDIVNDSLISVNKLTGAGTIVGALGFNANFGQSMDCDPGSGT